MKNYFAENLKYLREKKGWSQSELSRQTVRTCNIYNKNLPEEKHIKPITQASIARWEAGENSPSIDNLVILEETLLVRLPDLIGKDLKNTGKEKIELSKEQERLRRESADLDAKIALLSRNLGIENGDDNGRTKQL